MNNYDIKTLSDEIIDTLHSNWGGDKNKNRPWLCDLELLKLALISKNSNIITNCAEKALRGMHKNFLPKDATPLAVASINILENQNSEISPKLYEIASLVSHQTGNLDNSEKYIRSSIEKTEANDKNHYQLGTYYGQLGRIVFQKEKDKSISLHLFEKSKNYFIISGDIRGLAITLGDIARIKEQQGDSKGALKIHEENLILCQKIGDLRGQASTLGAIANIKRDGDSNSALKMYTEKLNIYDEINNIEGAGGYII